MDKNESNEDLDIILDSDDKESLNNLLDKLEELLGG